MSDDSRYDEIMRRIQQRQQQAAAGPRQTDLSTVLDLLNVMGCLEAMRRHPPPGVHIFKPQVFKGVLPADENAAPLPWVGAVLWHKPGGYFSYQTLTLVGAWAIAEADGVRALVGRKYLPFKAPVFNPEAVFHHLKRGFDLYYQGDASPPPLDSCLYQTPVDLKRRLALRHEIEAALRQAVLPAANE